MSRPKGSKNKKTIAKKIDKAIINKTIVETDQPLPVFEDDPISYTVEDSSDDSADNLTEPVESTEPTEPIESHKGRKPKSDDEKYIHCDRCNALIYSQANQVDTNLLTGRADYWRSSSRYVHLCDSCSKELSNIVDKFLMEKGFLKPKFFDGQTTAD